MSRNLLQAYAIKRPAFILGMDLIAVKESSAANSNTIFVHNYEDKVFLKREPEWKGKKGIGTVRSANAGIAAELEIRTENYETLARLKYVAKGGANENKFVPVAQCSSIPGFRTTNLMDVYEPSSLIEASTYSACKFGLGILSDVLCDQLANPASRFMCKIVTKGISKIMCKLMS